MKLKTRAGVHLSDVEFHGIMAAVARRINRTAMLGHPDASVGADQQFQDPPAAPLQGNWQQMFQPQQAEEGVPNAESTNGAQGSEVVPGG
jgi:hypothetical protein